MKTEEQIKYHVACKVNGDGCMDERKLSDVCEIKNSDGSAAGFEYRNAHVF